MGDGVQRDGVQRWNTKMFSYVEGFWYQNIPYVLTKKMNTHT